MARRVAGLRHPSRRRGDRARGGAAALRPRRALERTGGRDAGAPVGAAVGEAEEQVRLQPAHLGDAAIPEERQLALRRAARGHLLAPVEADAEAVGAVEARARADAIVEG